MHSQGASRTDGEPTPFPDLNRVLTDLAARAAACLGGNFVGAWLQGSFALGDGDACSDADFIVGLREDLSDEQVPVLDSMHGEIHDRMEVWAQHLEGSYVPAAILRRAPAHPYPLWFLNNGDRTLARSDHDDSNVVRWVLRERGIVLLGADPRDLIDPVAPATLRAEVRATLRDYGGALLAGTVPLDVLWRQGFVVLYCCRALQSLETATIPSKPAAVRWARANLDPRWTGLVERAFDQRARYPRGRGAPAAHAALKPDPAEAALTLDFVRYALDLAGESPASPRS